MESDTHASMVTLRWLPPSENSLASQPGNIEWPHGSAVLAAFDGDRLTGRTAVLTMPVIETTWVEQSRRGSTLAYSLIKNAEEMVKKVGWNNAFILVSDELIEGYAKRFGYEEVSGVKLFAKRM